MEELKNMIQQLVQRKHGQQLVASELISERKGDFKNIKKKIN